MKLSIVIAHSGQDCLGGTVQAVFKQLRSANVQHDVPIVDDNSKDGTFLVGQQ